MADNDTVFPYDDEVVDPYAADDTKNPHEATPDASSSDAGNGGNGRTPRKAAGRAAKSTKKA